MKASAWKLLLSVLVLSLPFVYAAYMAGMPKTETYVRRCVLFSADEITCMSGRFKVRLENQACENGGQSIVWLTDESTQANPVSALIGSFPDSTSDLKKEASKIKMSCGDGEGLAISIPGSLELRSAPGVVDGLAVTYERQ